MDRLTAHMYDLYIAGLIKPLYAFRELFECWNFFKLNVQTNQEFKLNPFLVELFEVVNLHILCMSCSLSDDLCCGC